MISMNLQQIHQYYGSYVELANILRINKQAINNWRRNGFIPIYRQMQIEKLTNGKLKASIEEVERAKAHLKQRSGEDDKKRKKR